jgi:hypothetical protein
MGPEPASTAPRIRRCRRPSAQPCRSTPASSRSARGPTRSRRRFRLEAGGRLRGSSLARNTLEASKLAESGAWLEPESRGSAASKIEVVAVAERRGPAAPNVADVAAFSGGVFAPMNDPSAGEIGGIFAGMVGLLVALGHAVKWWLGWTDRRAATRAAKLEAWHRELVAERGSARQRKSRNHRRDQGAAGGQQGTIRRPDAIQRQA